ncbi:MAG: MBL fold metallo-hydrolase [bacterium]
MRFWTSVFIFLCVLLMGVPLALAQKGEQIKMTVLYDNTIFAEGTQADWGFACLIEGTEKTILFDTGTKSDVLLHNLKLLKVDLEKVDQIVISHNHGDHTGGLSSVLDRNSKVSVYYPYSFPETFVQNVKGKGAVSVPVDKSVEICKHVYSTGEMGDQIKEQSLIVDTPKGLVIVTGCSHQGIVDVLKRAKEISDKDIYLVFGGFHLMQHSEAQVKEIIEAFRSLGVKKCGATHCTGDAAIDLFRKAFWEDYVRMGTGKVITISE